MIKQGLRNTLINKVWLRFFLFLLLTQLCLTLFIFIFGGRLAAMRLAITTDALTCIVRVVSQQNNPILMEQVITELTKNNKIIFKPNQVTKDNTSLPLQGSLLTFAKKYKNATPFFIPTCSLLIGLLKTYVKIAIPLAFKIIQS